MLGAALAGLLPAGAATPWLLTVQTTDVNQTYTIDIAAGTSPVIVVDWNDGTVETFTTTGLKTHTYAAARTYIAKLSGRFVSNGNIRFGSDATNRSRLKAISAAPYIPGLISFNSTFMGCSGLTGSIPADLFRYNTQVSTGGFNAVFYGCTNLTGSIPTDLFRYNTLVASNGFYSAFYGCTNLTGSIPADLFRYNTLVTSGFYQTFRDCTNLTGSIPTDLFRYNTQIASNGFNATFSGCTNLTGSIPTDLFRYNTQVSTSGFNATFYNCTNLTGSIPTDLFRYNTKCTSFNSTFYFCPKLQQNANIFYADGEQSTRFLNQSVDFTNCFLVTSYTGDQGVAPDLWNCTFGTGTPTTTNCWQGHSNATVSNFASIPVAWV